MADDKKEVVEVRSWDALRGWVLVKGGLTKEQAERKTVEDAGNGKVTWWNTKEWFAKRGGR